MIPKRYDIYYADLSLTIGSVIMKKRPVVIISRDEMNKYLETVVICPVTSKLHKKWRSRIQITCNKQKSEIAVDQIRTISKLRLIKKIDELNEKDAQKLRLLINEMYGE